MRQDETISVKFEDDDGVEHVVNLPTLFEVCSGCQGKGTHVNRSIDGNGLTRDDFEEDPDFEEAYFRGDYDVQCEDCSGLRVEVVIDEPRCQKDPTLKRALEIFYKRLQDRASDLRCQRMEAGDF